MTSTTQKAIEINYKLKKKRSSQAAIARIHGVTNQAVWNVVWSRSESLAIKRTIAKIIGESIETLWPQENEERKAA